MSKKLGEYDQAVIGQAMRHLRRERGLTQEQVASTLGLKRCSLTQMEQGMRRTQIDELIAFCRLCGKEGIDDFLGIARQGTTQEAKYLALREENYELRGLLRRTQQTLNNLQQSLTRVDTEMLDKQIKQIKQALTKEEIP